jgi:kynurenine formamidase
MVLRLLNERGTLENDGVAYQPESSEQPMLIDLSHTIEDGLVTYPGLPAPVICDFLSREASLNHYSGGATFQIGKIEMIANTGTYVDAPFHRFAGGVDLSELSLDRLADLTGVVVSSDSQAIDVAAFDDLDVTGRAVLIHTGWSRHWRTDRYAEHSPYLTRAAAELLVERGAAFVGIDSINIDDLADTERPVHTVLLGNGVPIGEHLTQLDKLPADGFRFHAAPVKVRGMGTFPVRAYAIV